MTVADTLGDGRGCLVISRGIDSQRQNSDTISSDEDHNTCTVASVGLDHSANLSAVIGVG